MGDSLGAGKPSWSENTHPPRPTEPCHLCMVRQNEYWVLAMITVLLVLLLLLQSALQGWTVTVNGDADVYSGSARHLLQWTARVSVQSGWSARTSRHAAVVADNNQGSTVRSPCHRLVTQCWFVNRNFILTSPAIPRQAAVVLGCFLHPGDVMMIITSCVGGRHSMPPPPASWPFDLESGVRVTCNVGYLYANFSIPRRLCSQLRPDVRDRQTSDAHHRLMQGRGYNNSTNNSYLCCGNNNDRISVLKQQ